VNAKFCVLYKVVFNRNDLFELAAAALSRAEAAGAVAAKLHKNPQLCFCVTTATTAIAVFEEEMRKSSSSASVLATKQNSSFFINLYDDANKHIFAAKM